MSFGLSRVGIDTAGGLITTSPQAFVKVGGALVACQGSHIADHGSGSHNAAVFPSGSTFLTINGVAVVIQGTHATCGHVATGSAFAKASN